VERVRFTGTDNGVRIKAARDRGADVSNITYKDLTMDGVKYPIMVTEYYPRAGTLDGGRTGHGLRAVEDAGVRPHRQLLRGEGPFGPVFNYADATDDLQISPVRTWLAERFHVPFAQVHMRALLADYLEHHPVTPLDRAIQGTVLNRFFVLNELWFP
jgi:hypothetical protein